MFFLYPFPFFVLANTQPKHVPDHIPGPYFVSLSANNADADPAEINNAIQPDPVAKAEADGDLRQRTKPNKPSRIIGLLKHAARGGVSAIRSADRATAHAGLKDAKFRAGVVRTRPPPPSGPVSFPARFDGRKGHAYIVTTPSAAEPPVLGWAPGEDDGDDKNAHPRWSISIADIHVGALTKREK